MKADVVSHVFRVETGVQLKRTQDPDDLVFQALQRMAVCIAINFGIYDEEVNLETFLSNCGCPPEWLEVTLEKVEDMIERGKRLFEEDEDGDTPVALVARLLKGIGESNDDTDE
jgi:hypothetical protein